MKKLILTLKIFAIIFSVTAFVDSSVTDEPIALTFVDHLAAGFVEQDVYVQKENGSGEVYRIIPEKRNNYLDASVYTTKKPHHHDPMNKENTGPFKVGKALDLTLKEWLGGSGSATYSCQEGWGRLKASFKNLVPNATYTMWHFFMPAPPTEPFTGTLDLPVGERDGSESIFKTDAQGNASYEQKFQPCLQLGDEQLVSGLAIAWHSDGKTYESDPGDFGKNSHVQLFAMLPGEDEVETGKIE